MFFFVLASLKNFIAERLLPRANKKLKKNAVINKIYCLINNNSKRSNKINKGINIIADNVEPTISTLIMWLINGIFFKNLYKIMLIAIQTTNGISMFSSCIAVDK